MQDHDSGETAVEQADEQSSDQIPPARDGEINSIPDLNPGDRIKAEPARGYVSTKTLTVEGTASDPSPKGLHWSNDDGYELSGYGTTYDLSTVDSMSASWRRVILSWKSQPEGVPVESIEIVERADDEEVA